MDIEIYYLVAKLFLKCENEIEEFVDIKVLRKLTHLSLSKFLLKTN